eukprot:CAMPEP_0117450310 /NCGR_PEP_ID=MMETSP0759-20121206/8399_1 /TAXON_ID=63605 /ORGANISM="Percolomonas cosmopolitus, Strain WS" /LENGTH=216 /DNA_ID=CAMNT_0005242821 /DNA_START=29 /DNA_END=679 /DNA_ORIENTATION=-
MSLDTTKPPSSPTLKCHHMRIGTTSEFIPLQHRPTIKDVNTHKWRLYLRGPPHQPDPSHLVKMLKVTLDESYAPNHEVSLTSYPFHISRRGFSGFVIPIKIHLWNGDVVEFNHELELKNLVDREIVERETDVEILIDEAEVFEGSTQDKAGEAAAAAKGKTTTDAAHRRHSGTDTEEMSTGEDESVPHKKTGKRRKKATSLAKRRKKKRLMGKQHE